MCNNFMASPLRLTVDLRSFKEDYLQIFKYVCRFDYKAFVVSEKFVIP